MAANHKWFNGRSKSFIVTESTGAESVELFSETVTLTSAAAATAVNIIPDARVGSGRKVYLLGMRAKVNGGTLWGTTANVFLEGTDQTAFITMAVAALAANALVFPNTANVTAGNPYALNAGGTAATGLQVRGNANGTGSDLVVTVYGVIKG